MRAKIAAITFMIILLVSAALARSLSTVSNHTPQVTPSATPRAAPVAGIPTGHTSTTWSVETNMAYDALCFIPTLTGDSFYLKFYQRDYDRFVSKLTPAVQQALDDIRTVARSHDSLLSSTLVQLFLPLGPQTLSDLITALDNPDAIRQGAGLASDDETWKLIAGHLPNLKIVIQWMQEAGFEQDYQERIYAQIHDRADQLNQQLPAYNIIPVLEAVLGKPLPSGHFTMYLAHYPLPFGIGLGANVSLFYADLPLPVIVDNAIHENLHSLDIQEKDLWEALSFLQQDSYYMNNFKIHDPDNGYMTYEQFLEEDVVEALDQVLAEQFNAAENPRSRWGSAPAGTHTFSPVLYLLLKQENYSPEIETYHDFLIRMVREGKLKAGTIEAANHAFYASNN